MVKAGRDRLTKMSLRRSGAGSHWNGGGAFFNRGMKAGASPEKVSQPAKSRQMRNASGCEQLSLHAFWHCSSASNEPETLCAYVFHPGFDPSSDCIREDIGFVTKSAHVWPTGHALY